jgi:hypothetical protein
MEIASARRFELAVCYRIYPRLSGDPILGFRDKRVMVHINLETFRAAIGNLKIKVWLLLDNCPPDYEKLAATILSDIPLEFVRLKGEGNEATFTRQIDILSRQEDAEVVYFIEDDYLHLPGALERGVAFLKRHREADALTLADHADYHRRYVDRVRSPQYDEEGHRWRKVVATALTFMIRRNALLRAGEVLKTFTAGNSDLGLWMALTKFRVFNPWCCIRGFGDGKFIPGSQALAWWHAWRYILFGKRLTLWAPTPTLATHLERQSAALDADWSQLYGGRIRQLEKNLGVI